MEAAIVLGVVGLVIGGIWVAAAAITEKRQVNQAVTDIGVIMSNVKNSLPPVGGYELQGPLLELVAPSSSVQNGRWFLPWNTSDDYNSILWDSTTGVVSFYFSGVPKAVCIQLGMRLYAAFSANKSPEEPCLTLANDDNKCIDTLQDATAFCNYSYNDLELYLKI